MTLTVDETDCAFEIQAKDAIYRFQLWMLTLTLQNKSIEKLLRTIVPKNNLNWLNC